MSALTAPSGQPGYHSPDAQLGSALDRLKRAVDGLEAALSRKERQTKSVATLEQELEVLLQDRSKLAHDLDQVKARASRLDAAGAEVTSRIDSVMSNLQSILARA